MWMPVAPWKLNPGTAQKLTTGAASVTSAAMGDPVTRPSKAILVSVTADAHIRIDPGASAVAAAATDFLIKAAWPPIVIGINPGDKLSVIQDAAGGFLYLQEIQH